MAMVITELPLVPIACRMNTPEPADLNISRYPYGTRRAARCREHDARPGAAIAIHDDVMTLMSCPGHVANRRAPIA